MSAIPGFYSAAEAAKKIGVSLSQITRYVQDKDIARRLKPKRIGRTLLFPQDNVDSFERPPRGNPNFGRQSA